MVATRPNGHQAQPPVTGPRTPYLSAAMTTPTSSGPVCAACGGVVTGRFCPGCGASAAQSSCRACRATLAPGAKFCHRCGVAATPAASPEQVRTALIVAGLAVVLTVAGIAYKLGKGSAAPAAVSMANAGNAGAAAAPGGNPPDISRMTPRERFDRLFDRVIRAAEARSADTVAMFAPMALAAFDQLDQVDADARYHAAMIHLALGDFPQALAQADSILAGQAKHLFAFVIQGEVAEQKNDTKALDRAYAAFLAAYDTETKAKRPEYTDHQPSLDDFRNRALANRK